MAFPVLKYQKIILILIVLLGFILRFYALGSIPSGLYGDEVALGYNSYALFKTGTDEFGRHLPLNYLESYGDFKPPLYSYATVIPISIFGLNEFSVRFVSAISGVIMILTAYFLCKEIFYNSKNRDYYGLLACFLVSISFWNINLSRAAFESNFASTLIALGLLFFLKFINGRKYYLLLSALLFSLSLVTYNSARVVVPLILLTLLISFFGRIRSSVKITILSIVIGALIVVPSVSFLLSPQAATRFDEVNIFTNLQPIIDSNQEKINNPEIWANLTSNRRIFFAREYLENYLSHFGYSYLFISGDGNPKFSTQRVGQLYFVELFFILIGLIVLFRKKESHWFLVPTIILIGFIPAGVSYEAPHSLRAANVIPMIQILSAYGFYWVISWVLKLDIRKNLKYLIIIFIFSTIFVELFYYLHDYYNHYTREYSIHWNYGARDIVNYINDNSDKYKQVFISKDFERGYIYSLFYNKVLPNEFLTTSKIDRDQFGFVHINSIGKINYEQEISKLTLISGNLYLVRSDKLPERVKVVHTIYDANGKPKYYFITL